MPIDTDRLMIRIESMRDELVQLTQDLIRIPTLNPPGECYRDICDYLDTFSDAGLIKKQNTPWT